MSIPNYHGLWVNCNGKIGIFLMEADGPDFHETNDLGETVSITKLNGNEAVVLAKYSQIPAPRRPSRELAMAFGITDD